MAAVVQAHAHDGVAVLAEGLIDGEVGLSAGVGLHIGITGAEELLGPVSYTHLDVYKRQELSQAAAGAKIDKIYQPGRDEVVLALRSPTQGNVRLLLSANPTHPRPQLTRLSRENPDTPPMFCMLLRKHLALSLIHI